MEHQCGSTDHGIGIVGSQSTVLDHQTGAAYHESGNMNHGNCARTMGVVLRSIKVVLWIVRLEVRTMYWYNTQPELHLDHYSRAVAHESGSMNHESSNTMN